MRLLAAHISLGHAGVCTASAVVVSLLTLFSNMQAIVWPVLAENAHPLKERSAGPNKPLG